MIKIILGVIEIMVCVPIVFIPLFSLIAIWQEDGEPDLFYDINGEAHEIADLSNGMDIVLY